MMADLPLRTAHALSGREGRDRRARWIADTSGGAGGDDVPPRRPRRGRYQQTGR